jgi:hypothetical protein
LALLDSGIPLLYTPLSSTISFSLSEKNNLFDNSKLNELNFSLYPTKEEEESSYSSFTISYKNTDLIENNNNVVGFISEGKPLLNESIIPLITEKGKFYIYFFLFIFK